MGKSIIQSDINFNNVKDGGKLQSSTPVWTGVDGIDEFGGIINAIDIDWNGAEVDDNHEHDINTTGLLINYIKGAYSSGGGSLSSGFAADEIDRLKALVTLDDNNETYISKLDSRVAGLAQTLSSIEELLTKLTRNASKVTFTPKSGGYLSEIKVEPAVGGSSVTGQVVGGLLTPLSNGTKQYGVVDISNDFAKKLDKTAISYDGSGNLTIDLN